MPSCKQPATDQHLLAFEEVASLLISPALGLNEAIKVDLHGYRKEEKAY